MAFVEVNGQHLYYQDTGGEGEPIVFSHGLLMDHTMWEPQIFAMRNRWRLITYDERCHGQTESTGEPFSYWALAGDLGLLLDHVGVERAVLVGMSQGGFISLRFALLHPERVAALVLIDTQAGREDPDKVDTYRTMLELWEEEGLNDMTAEMIAAIILGNDDPNRQDWFAKWRSTPMSCIRLAWKCLVEREDIHDRLHEIAVPTLVIHGEDDAAIPIEMAHALTAGIPDATGPVIVPGAGHASNLAQPAVVNATISDFLTQKAVWR